MCTVTVVPHERGVRLFCNRDERRTRLAALPPRIYDLGSRLAVFPVDPQGGGTWIGVNDAGVMVALLNVHRRNHAPEEQPRWSRGLIVRELLHCRSLPHATAVLESLDPHAFEPFKVIIVHEGLVAVATNNATARIRCTRRALEGPLLFTSSSLGDTLVRPPRQRLFQRMVVRNGAGWLAGQARFHDHQWSRCPEVSIRMERNDALTVSRTRIDVTNDTRQLLYEAPLDAATPDRVHEWCSLH